MLTYESFIALLSKKTDREFNLYQIDNDFILNIDVKDLNIFVKNIKEDEQIKFNQLIDITVIDYPTKEKRFELVYFFLSLLNNQRLKIKIHIKENEKVESITHLFQSSNWYERECFDLFGVQFSNHPDLRRILTDYNFEGYPLRKDFPLTGKTEVRYDEIEKKVIYENVNLQQEYRNFDYSSPWEGIPNELKGDEKAEKSKKDEERS